MPKRSSKDINVIATNVVGQVIVKNLAAVTLGRLGGKKGGKARAQKLTPEQRSEIARKAAKARWAKVH
jgi:hypothetical protein